MPIVSQRHEQKLRKKISSLHSHYHATQQAYLVGRELTAQRLTARG